MLKHFSVLIYQTQITVSVGRLMRLARHSVAKAAGACSTANASTLQRFNASTIRTHKQSQDDRPGIFKRRSNNVNSQNSGYFGTTTLPLIVIKVGLWSLLKLIVTVLTKVPTLPVELY